MNSGGGASSAESNATSFQDGVVTSLKNLHGWAQNLEANIVIIAKQHNKLCEIIGKEKTEKCLLKVVPPPTFSSSSKTKMDEEEPEDEKKMHQETHERGKEKEEKSEEGEIPDSK